MCVIPHSFRVPYTCKVSLKSKKFPSTFLCIGTKFSYLCGYPDPFSGLPGVERLLQDQVPQGATRGGSQREGLELGGGKVQGVAAPFLCR